MSRTTKGEGRSGRGKPQILILEGEIAAGKTEMVRALEAALQAHGMRAMAVYEPVDEWEDAGALKAFYENPAEMAYKFQTFAYSTRALRIRRTIDENPEVEVFILERSPLSDRLFAALQRFTPLESRMYETWCQAHDYILPFDLREAKFLYLQTSLEECMQRLAKRGRQSENSVTAEYQRKLRAVHRAAFAGEASEFPALAARVAELNLSVAVVGPELADRDFRRGGAAGAGEVVDQVIRLSGIVVG